MSSTRTVNYAVKTPMVTRGINVCNSKQCLLGFKEAKETLRDRGCASQRAIAFCLRHEAGGPAAVLLVTSVSAWSFFRVLTVILVIQDTGSRVWMNESVRCLNKEKATWRKSRLRCIGSEPACVTIKGCLRIAKDEFDDMRSIFSSSTSSRTELLCKMWVSVLW